MDKEGKGRNRGEIANNELLNPMWNLSLDKLFKFHTYERNINGVTI